MIALLTDDFTVSELADAVALFVYQPAAIAKWGATACGVSRLGQIELCEDHLFRQLEAEATALVVVDHRGNRLSQVLAGLLRHGPQGFIHEDQPDTQLAKLMLQIDAIDRAVGPGEAVPAGNEDVGDSLISDNLGLEGIKRRPREQVPLNTIIEEQVARRRNPIFHHSFDRFSRATERHAQVLGPTEASCSHSRRKRPGHTSCRACPRSSLNRILDRCYKPPHEGLEPTTRWLTAGSSTND